MAPLQQSNIGSNYLYRFKSEGSGRGGREKRSRQADFWKDKREVIPV